MPKKTVLEKYYSYSRGREIRRVRFQEYGGDVQFSDGVIPYGIGLAVFVGHEAKHDIGERRAPLFRLIKRPGETVAMDFVTVRDPLYKHTTQHNE